MRTVKKIKLISSSELKIKLLCWAQQFEEVVWLDSNSDANQKNLNYSSFDHILAVDALTSIKTDFQEAFVKLAEYQKHTADWIFGYLTYDLKNAGTDLTSNNADGAKFSELYFFQPKKIFFLKGQILELHYLHFVADEIDDDIHSILNDNTHKNTKDIPKPNIEARTSKNAYIDKVKEMQHHIQRGDIYEANFCMEFFAEHATIDPLKTFLNLNSISEAPFACFLKLESNYLLSASPERYLKKEGKKIISQPIKGTAPRSQNQELDTQLSANLQSDKKERSENIMITDLVRNDLSRTAKRGSVRVEELCGLYTFKQVHQLISTIISEVETSTLITDVLKTTFPMGSMTGAPKESALKIIEKLEDSKRGLYSGTMGYISPQGDADFNVVIRSILYNETLKYLSFSVGSAITFKSDPEKEYEECILKSKAMRQVLES